MRTPNLFFLTCILGTCLLNSPLFGNISLIAYFGFCIVTLIALSVCSRDLLNIPAPVKVFLVLAAYIYLHGVFNQNVNLTLYYWLSAAALLLLAMQSGKVQTSSKKIRLHQVIIVIALIESMVVILQWLRIVPSMNEQFRCTGTWANPNVTAMFIALSLWSQKEFIKHHTNRILIVAQLSVILLSICFLQCRTAYIVAAILLVELFKFNIPFRKALVIKMTAITLVIAALAFGIKTDSTGGRMQIWKNSVQMIMNNPITGVGFGRFEKEYNLFVSQQNLPSNDHVYMAYNDFLELAVEGGIIPVTLYIAFLVLLIIRFKNDPQKLSLVISFIVIQLTNFGFQAIPAFALFLIYIGTSLQLEKEVISAPGKKLFIPKLIPALVIAGGLILCIKLISVANAFQRAAAIQANYEPREAIKEFEDLGATLNFSANYHENYGDLYMRTGKFQDAMLQFQYALQSTSRPAVLGKCGWCYGQLSNYDSARYYFKIIEKLQPHKYGPRMALLKLYEQQKDTSSIRLKAREIIMMPVKVPSKEVDIIKSAARKWWQEEL